MKNQRHAFAIVRVDGPLDLNQPEDIANRIMVKEIVGTQALAEAEVARLTQLNADKGCVYFWQITRLVGDLAHGDSKG